MLKSLIIKILAKIILILGLIFRKKRSINSKAIKSILINRSDRLGDAIISLPLLIELNKRFEITVLTSQYNDLILNSFVKTKIFNYKPLSFLESVNMILKNVLYSRHPKKGLAVPEYDLYLDLMGIRGLDVFLKIKKLNLCRYCADFNLGIWNLFLDSINIRNPALFSKSHTLDSQRELINRSLELNLDVPDYIDLTPKMVKPGDFNVQSPYILVNISGSNKFRGPTPQMFAQILNGIVFDGKIIIMAELEKPDLNGFKKYILKDNIIYLEREYSVWELLYIAQKSLLYIGSDLGITQILGIPTNCIVFFADNLPMSWKPYSKNSYQMIKIGKTVIEETKNSKGLIKKVIYRPVWCSPCFDTGCHAYPCIRKIDKITARDQINQTLRGILN